jgi:hypothetical protein
MPTNTFTFDLTFGFIHDNAAVSSRAFIGPIGPWGRSRA